MSDSHVAIVVFDRISPFHLAIPCAVFDDHGGGGRLPSFTVSICATERGSIRTTAGFEITARYGLAKLRSADIVIVPSWRDAGEPPPPALVNALRKAHARGARIVGLCLGSFVIAAAGLLDGRKATTHWQFAQQLAQQYPQVQVDVDALYIDHEDVLTSAGAAASLDCCLHLLRSLHGAEAASFVARRLVVPPHRRGGQAQYIDRPLSEAGEVDRFADVIEWSQKNLHKAQDLDGLARRACMSRRSFTRRFRQAMGTTVGQWLLHQRLALAQRLLETTAHDIETIATRAGFGSAVSLRQYFARELRTSPSAYRREFKP
jgi:transcriptional regulator GlxA family with amidase domain